MGPETPIAPAPGSETIASVDLGRVVDEVEAGIDDLMFMLKVNGGMPEVEAALRAARRLLTRSHGGELTSGGCGPVAADSNGDGHGGDRCP